MARRRCRFAAAARLFFMEMKRKGDVSRLGGRALHEGSGALVNTPCPPEA
uniref:Uncharacterized protein n=1 Tax=Nitratidesulfovibrio vulgaris (strain DSM 19637 / Miyazaki F) TaxID=883 RepID=B8DM95_NITV9